MVNLMGAIFHQFKENHHGTDATRRKRANAVKELLEKGADHVTGDEISQGEINPKTLVKLIRRETSDRDGYLHPFYKRQKRQPNTLKSHLG